MQNNLVIVESPAKAKTIEKFLGEGYKVLSSYGHIRDLKQKAFSIDIKSHFKPIYEIPEDKKKLVAELKEEAAKADMVWLAVDQINVDMTRMLYSLQYSRLRNFVEYNPSCFFRVQF